MATIIAEAGVEHNGDVVRAIALVKAAKKAGADAVKFQLFTREARPFGGKYILTLDEWQHVRDVARAEEIEIFWSVFDFESLQDAGKLGAKWVKLSFVCKQNSRLIARCNEVGFVRRFISVDLYGQYNAEELSGWEKLYCPNTGWKASYPTPDSEIEWNRYWRKAKDYGLGYSCHHRTMYPCLVAVAFGAAVIEKHFKVDDDGPDSSCALDPAEFELMAGLAQRTKTHKLIIHQADE